jgi:glycosyltransferase involved in cell wall biosynthesis
MKPAISVLMSVFNSEKYLQEAIESVLNQTFTDFEFLIIDDCSTDSSLEIIKNYKDSRIRIFRNPVNSGLIKSLNYLIDKAKGRFLARLDSDDIALPNRFETQYNLMNSDKNLVLSASNCLFIDQNSNMLNSGRHFLSSKNDLDNDFINWLMLFPENHIIHSSVMMRAETLKNNRLHYSNSAKHAEDIELWIRLSRYGKMKIIKEPLVKFRILEDSITSQKNQTQIAISRDCARNNQQQFFRQPLKESVENNPFLLCRLYERYLRKIQNSGEIDAIKNDYSMKMLKIVIRNLLKAPVLSKKGLKLLFNSSGNNLQTIFKAFFRLVEKKAFYLLSHKRPLKETP